MTRNQTPTRPRRAPAPHKHSAPNKDPGPRAGDDDAEFIQWELETLRPPTQRRVHSSGERRVTVTKPAPTYAPVDTSGVSETDDGNARFRRETGGLRLACSLGASGLGGSAVSSDALLDLFRHALGMRCGDAVRLLLVAGGLLEGSRVKNGRLDAD